MLRWVCLLAVIATGVGAFSVSTSTPSLRVKENAGADLTCTHSADFGPNARVEWKFNNMKESQTYIVFDGKPTEPYANRITVHQGNVRFNKMTRVDTGEYDCEVSGNGQFGEAKVRLTVLVPTAAPVCNIPTSVTTKNKALLTCSDRVGSPPPTYMWFRDGVLLPENPKQFPAFQNSTFRLNKINGNLEFASAAKADTGDYYCEATNGVGPVQKCKAVRMEVRDVNTGGIVAGVIVALLLVALLLLGLWYANKKGYLPKPSESKPKPSVIYQPPSSHAGGEEEDGEFRQKSSFVV